jgi:hypothetical protein
MSSVTASNPAFVENPGRWPFEVGGNLNWYDLEGDAAVSRIPEMRNKDTFFLEVYPRTFADRTVKVFGEDRQTKNLSLRKVRTEDDGREVVITRMAASYDEKTGRARVPLSQNRVVVVEARDDGRVAIWEVAVVNQDEKFFVTVQRKYRFRCYRDDEGRLACPEFEKRWPDLIAHIVEMVGDRVVNFSPVGNYASDGPVEKKMTDEGLAKGQGRVIWFDFSRGLGRIRLLEGKEARVYWKAVAPTSPNHFAYLVPGERVSVRTLVRFNQPSRDGADTEVLGVDSLDD